jgi:hypothetical protein
MHGNDCQSWQNSTDAALAQAVARGIRSVDKIHIHTVELDYPTSGSLDDPQWTPLIELDAAYTYFLTYAQILVDTIGLTSNPSSWLRHTMSSSIFLMPPAVR